jgi:hypothetical protein
MASVNDLAANWMYRVAQTNGRKAVDACAEELRNTARTAWHPVSEPPTAEDADDNDLVLMFTKYKETDHVHWDVVAKAHMNTAITHWARIRDVVLLPPEGD